MLLSPPALAPQEELIVKCGEKISLVKIDNVFAQHPRKLNIVSFEIEE